MQVLYLSLLKVHPSKHHCPLPGIETLAFRRSEGSVRSRYATMPPRSSRLHLRCSSRQAPQHRLAFCSITSRTVSRPRTRVDFQSTPHEPLALQARVVQSIPHVLNEPLYDVG